MFGDNNINLRAYDDDKNLVWKMLLYNSGLVCEVVKRSRSPK